jgi:Flp pilus assembly protein TadB
MKITRLFQPRNPLFWMVLALHSLSVMLVWIVHNRPLSTAGMLLVGGFALCNAVLGTWLAWRLVRDDSALNRAVDQ